MILKFEFWNGETSNWTEYKSERISTLLYEEGSFATESISYERSKATDIRVLLYKAQLLCYWGLECDFVVPILVSSYEGLIVK